MTAKAPTPMPENAIRPKAPSAPPKLTEDSLFINFRDTPNGGFCADTNYDSQAWQKLLNDWSEFKTEAQRLLKDPEYSKQWVEEEVKKSGEWFLEEIYK